jgi:hypothetical protein
MPRDGTETYVLPFPDVEEDTTIESTVYNGFTNDVAADLNTPRPIKFGGTGATTPAQALENLGGELADQVVSNYDSHVFQSGSFYSDASATAPPVAGHAFAGIVYTGPTASDMFLEAADRDDSIQPGAKYIRQKKAGVWSLWQKFAGVSTGTTPPAVAGDNALWWDPTLGKLFVYYNDGNSKQWVETNAVPDVDPNTYVEVTGDAMTGFLSLNANPTAPMHAVPKQYSDAAVALKVAKAGDTMTGALVLPGNAVNALEAVPKQQLDAAIAGNVTKKNYIINGAMQVSQENGGTTGTTSGFYAVDGFNSAYGYGGVATFGQAQNITPGNSTHRVRVTVTTADAAVAAADYYSISQKIEGLRIADLRFGTASAKSVTLRFGVKAPAGTYCVAFYNSAGDRTRVTEYVIAAGEANTDVLRTITIPGDTAGTWLQTNGIGMTVIWTLMSGTTYQATKDVWNTTNTFGTAAQFNFFGTNGNVFELFDVGLYEGTTAPPFLVPDYASELALCQRYFEKSTELGTVLFNSLTGTRTIPFSNGSTGVDSEHFITNKRAAPTMIIYSPISGTAARVYHNGVGDATCTADSVTTMSFRLYPTVGVTTNCYYHFSANARL